MRKTELNLWRCRNCNKIIESIDNPKGCPDCGEYITIYKRKFVRKGGTSDNAGRKHQKKKKEGYRQIDIEKKRKIGFNRVARITRKFK